METDSYHVGTRDYGYDPNYGYGRDMGAAQDTGRHMNSSNPRLDDSYLHYHSNDGMDHNIGGSMHADVPHYNNHNDPHNNSHLNPVSMGVPDDAHSHHSQQFEPYVNLPPPRTAPDYPNVWDREANAGDERDYGSPLPHTTGTLSRADKFGTVDLYPDNRPPSAVGSDRHGYRYPQHDNNSHTGRPSSNMGHAYPGYGGEPERIEPSWQHQDYAPPVPDNVPRSGSRMSNPPPVHVSPPLQDGWRNPELQEVIEFLSNPNDRIKANAAAYLQHLSFGNDPIKTETRHLGGIQPLVELLYSEIPEVHQNAVGALRNLSYGRNNDENKREIRKCGGLVGLANLLERSPRSEVRELVTAVLWNLSSSNELKGLIIDQVVPALVSVVILPHAGLEKRTPDGYVSQQREIYWSTLFRNASGVIRNVSSDGDLARKKLRETDGLVDSLIHIVRSAITNNDMDNKSVENCVCTLRNLCYACQEVVDPTYLRKRDQSKTAKNNKNSGAEVGCLGKKSKPNNNTATANGSAGNNTAPVIQKPLTGPATGQDLLWQPQIVELYLPILSECSNPETLEAAAGAIQNLAACDWQPSIEIRTQVRKEKGLPIMVELLSIGSDRVVCAAATALRNLAIDQRNKELIGKYAMEQLVARLPRESEELKASNETIAAVLATIYTVIKGNQDFAVQFLDQGGVHRCMYITSSKKFNAKVTRFAATILHTLWHFKDLQPRYREMGWRESNFGVKSGPSLGGKSHHPVDPSLNRPGQSQSGPSARMNTLPKEKMVQRHNGIQPKDEGVNGRHDVPHMTSEPGYGTLDHPNGDYSHHDNHNPALSTTDVRLDSHGYPYDQHHLDAGVALEHQPLTDPRLHGADERHIGYDNAGLDPGYHTVDGHHTLPSMQHDVGYDNTAFHNGGVVAPDDIPMQTLTLNDYNPYSHNSIDRRSVHSNQPQHSYHQSNPSLHRDANFTAPDEQTVGGMEPLYARVDREKKLSSRKFQGSNGSGMNLSATGGYDTDPRHGIPNASHTAGYDTDPRHGIPSASVAAHYDTDPRHGIPSASVAAHYDTDPRHGIPNASHTAGYDTDPRHGIPSASVTAHYDTDPRHGIPSASVTMAGPPAGADSWV